MYSLPSYTEKDPQVIMDFVKAHPFAFLSGCSADHKPVATQVPVFIDERDGVLFLSGHIMKNTDHHKAFVQNPNALAVFTGAHHYVSASWYENKQQGSTWNYMSVHARGTLRFVDEAALREILKRTTSHFENNPYSGANFDDLPSSYVDALVKAIVAFEIKVEKLDHVFKLSQDRDEKSYGNIIEQLGRQDASAQEISQIMKERQSKVFPS